MKTLNTNKLVAIAGLLVITASSAMANDDSFRLKANLSGFQQAPSVMTQGKGDFQATVYKDRIRYRIRFWNLSSSLTEAHIHFAQAGANGGVMVNFCKVANSCNFGNQGTVAYANSVAILEATLTAQDVEEIAPQFVTKGNFNQLLRAVVNGATYVNLHTQKIDGEVRGQISVDK
jgi:hypothetical protein